MEPSIKEGAGLITDGSLLISQMPETYTPHVQKDVDTSWGLSIQGHVRFFPCSLLGHAYIEILFVWKSTFCYVLATAFDLKPGLTWSHHTKYNAIDIIFRSLQSFICSADTEVLLHLLLFTFLGEFQHHL